MKYAVIVDSPATIDFHRHVNARLGFDHPGFVASFAGETGTGLRVISVWESKGDADRFFAEQLGPLVAEMVGPDRAGSAEITELEVQEYALGPSLQLQH
jgi:hypothetical protein